MTFYYITFFIPVILSIFFSILEFKDESNFKKNSAIFLIILLTFFIGFRSSVGGDWERYYKEFDYFLHLNYACTRPTSLFLSQ